MESFRGRACEFGNIGNRSKRFPSIYGKIFEAEKACGIDVEDGFGCCRVIDDPVFGFVAAERCLRAKDIPFLRDGELF